MAADRPCSFPVPFPSPAGRSTAGLLAQGLALVALAAPLLAPLGRPALASSPAAWAEFDRQVRTACLKASGLGLVRVQGYRLDLPSQKVSTLLLEGSHRQHSPLAGQRAQELCVYHRSSGQAEVGDAAGLLGSGPKSPGSP